MWICREIVSKTEDDEGKAKQKREVREAGRTGMSWKGGKKSERQAGGERKDRRATYQVDQTNREEKTYILPSERKATISEKNKSQESRKCETLPTNLSVCQPLAL